MALLLLIWWFFATFFVSHFFKKRSLKKWVELRREAIEWAEDSFEDSEYRLVAVELVLILLEHTDERFEIGNLKLDEPISEQIFVLSGDFSGFQHAARRYFKVKSPKITRELTLREWIRWFADQAKKN